MKTAERYLTAFKTKMISYENMPLQRALGAEVKKVVASRMVIGGEISFELLQGLLVFLAW